MKNQVANFISKFFGEINLQLRALKWRVTISFFLTLEAEMLFHSRETTALIWVLFLHTLPQTHPLSLSLSLSLWASAFLAFHCACDICPTQLDLMRGTAWSMRSESERTARKSEGVKERNKELCCFCQQLAAEDHPILPNGHPHLPRTVPAGGKE